MKFNQDIYFNICFNRLLAKNGIKNELKYSGLKNNLLDDGNNRDLKYRTENISAYEKLSKTESNTLRNKNMYYKNRHSKNNGLVKLDSYFEKKLFKRLDYIHELAEKMKNNKMSYRKKIFKKYCIGLIFFALLPILGLILPMLFRGGKDALIPICANDCKKHVETATGDYTTEHFKISYLSPLSNEQLGIIEVLNEAISYILSIIVISVVIYSLIKVIKYKRLRYGKGKTSVK